MKKSQDLGPKWRLNLEKKADQEFSENWIRIRREAKSEPEFGSKSTAGSKTVFFISCTVCPGSSDPT